MIEKTKVIDVYHKVMARAKVCEERAEEQFQKEKTYNDLSRQYLAMVQELYWVARHLEQTEEVNPTK